MNIDFERVVGSKFQTACGHVSIKESASLLGCAIIHTAVSDLAVLVRSTRLPTNAPRPVDLERFWEDDIRDIISFYGVTGLNHETILDWVAPYLVCYKTTYMHDEHRRLKEEAHVAGRVEAILEGEGLSGLNIKINGESVELAGEYVTVLLGKKLLRSRKIKVI